MAKPRRSLPQKLIIELTGTETPEPVASFRLCFGGGASRSGCRFSGPKGSCSMVRQGDHLEIQWGEDKFVAFEPTGAGRAWQVMEENR